MTRIVLVVLLFAGAVIAVDTVRQRRIRARRAIDLRGIVTARLAEPNDAVLAAIPSALARDPSVEANLYETLAAKLELATFRPRVQDGAEAKVFRLRWGNDYAMLARADRELHYRLEVWEAELLP